MEDQVAVLEAPSTELAAEKVLPVITISPIVDALELEMRQFPSVECPLEHQFTPGMYIRTIRVAAGTKLVTKIHLTEHPFAMTKGSGRIWTPESGWTEIFAPFIGITKVGTRRVIEAFEDIEWTTFHATTETDVKTIEDTITLQRGDLNPLEIPN